MSELDRVVLLILRHLLYKWSEWTEDLGCPFDDCPFETDGPLLAGSGFVTLEMFLHLRGHSLTELESWAKEYLPYHYQAH